MSQRWLHLDNAKCHGLFSQSRNGIKMTHVISQTSISLTQYFSNSAQCFTTKCEDNATMILVHVCSQQTSNKWKTSVFIGKTHWLLTIFTKEHTNHSLTCMIYSSCSIFPQYSLRYLIYFSLIFYICLLSLIQSYV